MRIVYLDPSAAGRPLTNEQIEWLANGEARLYDCYRPEFDGKSMKLSPSARAAFEAAKRNGYHHSKPSNVAFLAHYWEEANNRPMVCVQLKKRVAIVTLDLVSLPREEVNVWCLQERAVVDLAQALDGTLKYFGVYNTLHVPSGEGDVCAQRLVALYSNTVRAPGAPLGQFVTRS